MYQVFNLAVRLGWRTALAGLVGWGVWLPLGLAQSGPVPKTLTAAEWRVELDLAPPQYDKLFEKKGREWQRAEWVRAYYQGEEPRLASLWLPNAENQRWASKYGLTAERLAEEDARQQEMNLRLSDLATLGDDEEVKFLAVWRRESAETALAWQVGLNLAELRQELAKGEKRRVLRWKSYEKKGQPHFVVLWGAVGQGTGEVEFGILPAQLDQRAELARRRGWWPGSVAAYYEGPKPMLAVAWEPALPQAAWQLDAQLTAGQLAAKLAGRKQGPPFDLVSYEREQETRFAVIWRK